MKKMCVRIACFLSAVGCMPAHSGEVSLDLLEQYVSLLGVPERALIGTIRQLQQLPKPLKGPRNMRARWIQRDVLLKDESFNTAFYLESGRVQRIELVSNAPNSQCRSKKPWSTTIATLETWQGLIGANGSLTGGSTEQLSVHWLKSNSDVSAFLSVGTESCTTKVVIKSLELKDASSL